MSEAASVKETGVGRPGEPGSNTLLDIVLTVALPSIILSKLSGPERLGQVNAFCLALAIPFVYGLIGLVRAKRFNPFALIGLASVVLTGGLGFLEAEAIWFAVKEAAIPGILCVATLVSLRSENSFVKKMIYNDKIINRDRVEASIASMDSRAEFQKLIRNTGFLFAASLLLSCALNFVLTMFILRSPTGTAAFNEELGKLQALSYPVIVVPCLVVMMLALWYLTSGLKRLTGLTLDEILKAK